MNQHFFAQEQRELTDFLFRIFHFSKGPTILAGQSHITRAEILAMYRSTWVPAAAPARCSHARLRRHDTKN
jgi:hypothetical protein